MAHDRTGRDHSNHVTTHSPQKITVKDYLLGSFHGLLAAWEHALLEKAANSQSQPSLEIRGAQLIATTRIALLSVLRGLPEDIQNKVISYAKRVAIGQLLGNSAITFNDEDGQIAVHTDNVHNLAKMIISITAGPENDAVQYAPDNDNQPLK